MSPAMASALGPPTPETGSGDRASAGAFGRLADAPLWMRALDSRLKLRRMTDKMRQRADLAVKLFEPTPHPGMNDQEPEYFKEEPTMSTEIKQVEAVAARRLEIVVELTEHGYEVQIDSAQKVYCFNSKRAARLFIEKQFDEEFPDAEKKGKAE